MTERTISDADVEAIAMKVKDMLVQDFYKDLGKGLWGLVVKGLFVFLLVAAAIGAGVIKLPDPFSWGK